MKILIADDEWLERKALAKMIQTELPEMKLVGEAVNGRQAIALADEHLPDIVLMDIKMPGIDGVEAVKTIRSKHGKIRFIMISAYDTFDYAREVMRQGVKEYILKPGKSADIIEAIRRAEAEIREERRVEKLLQETIPDEEDAGKDPVDLAKEFIDKNFKKNISLEEAAERANLSPYHFSKLFKERSGATFIDYVTELRISYAKREILETDKSLKEICFGSGYKDPNYFSRVFRRRTGFSPTEYRQQG